jgi:transcription initiation factor IIE alpha subunit
MRRRNVKKAIEQLDNDKFIVINKKRFEELNKAAEISPNGYFRNHWAVLKLKIAVDEFTEAYERHTGKKLDQKYIVCNQDEPYADKVAALILEGENEKG